MTVMTANVAMPTPARYMNRLAKHFEHRVTVERSEQHAKINFPDCDCRLVATDTELQMRLETNDEALLARLQEVVTRHLKQVASQETFDVVWQRAA